MVTNILNSVPYERLNSKLSFVSDSNIVYSGAHELKIMNAQR